MINFYVKFLSLKRRFCVVRLVMPFQSTFIAVASLGIHDLGFPIGKFTGPKAPFYSVVSQNLQVPQNPWTPCLLSLWNGKKQSIITKIVQCLLIESYNEATKFFACLVSLLSSFSSPPPSFFSWLKVSKNKCNFFQHLHSFPLILCFFHALVQQPLHSVSTCITTRQNRFK